MKTFKLARTPRIQESGDIKIKNELLGEGEYSSPGPGLAPKRTLGNRPQFRRLVGRPGTWAWLLCPSPGPRRRGCGLSRSLLFKSPALFPDPPPAPLTAPPAAQRYLRNSSPLAAPVRPPVPSRPQRPQTAARWIQGNPEQHTEGKGPRDRVEPRACADQRRSQVTCAGNSYGALRVRRFCSFALEFGKQRVFVIWPRLKAPAPLCLSVSPSPLPLPPSLSTRRPMFDTRT